MKEISPKTTRAELASIVSEALRGHGIDSVLVGGSVVSLYSKGKYVTHDLDFVTAELKRVRAALEPAGFEFVGRLASHVSTDYILDFVAPPLAIGNKPIEKTSLKKNRAGSFRTLTATDCVLDRLASYYFWNDEQALEQAVLVATMQKIDMAEVERWTRAEGTVVGAATRFVDKLKIFRTRLGERP